MAQTGTLKIPWSSVVFYCHVVGLPGANLGYNRSINHPTGHCTNRKVQGKCIPLMLRCLKAVGCLCKGEGHKLSGFQKKIITRLSPCQHNSSIKFSKLSLELWSPAIFKKQTSASAERPIRYTLPGAITDLQTPGLGPRYLTQKFLQVRSDPAPSAF